MTWILLTRFRWIGVKAGCRLQHADELVAAARAEVNLGAVDDRSIGMAVNANFAVPAHGLHPVRLQVLDAAAVTPRLSHWPRPHDIRTSSANTAGEAARASPRHSMIAESSPA